MITFPPLNLYNIPVQNITYKEQIKNDELNNKYARSYKKRTNKLYSIRMSN